MKNFKYLGLVLAIVLTASLVFAGATVQKDDYEFRGNVSLSGEVPNTTARPLVQIQDSYATTTITGTTVSDITNSDLIIPVNAFNSGETITWDMAGITNKYSTHTVAIMIYAIDTPIVTSTIGQGVRTGNFRSSCTLKAATSTLSHALCETEVYASSSPYLKTAVSTTTIDFITVQKDLSAGGTFKSQIVHDGTISSTTVEYVRVKYNN